MTWFFSSYPVVMDESGALMREYYINAFPTTFMISADGSVYGYVTGSMPGELMEEIIRQTEEGG